MVAQINDKITSKESGQLYKLFIIILALIVSFLYGLPHLLWLNDLHWDYRNAIFITSFTQCFDNGYHLARIKEIYEGHYQLSNAYLAEYKDEKSPLWAKAIPVYLVAFIGKTFHIKVHYLAVLMDFILPATIFFVVYLFLYTARAMRSTSIFGAFILVLIPHIFRLDILHSIGSRLLSVWNLQNLWRIIPPLLSDAHCYECFARKLNPQLSYLFLLLSLLFFLKGLTTLKNRYFVLSFFWGIVTTYSYVFFSSYLYVFLAISAIAFGLLKKKKYVQKSLVVLIAVILCSIPFWYSVLSFSKEEMIARNTFDKRYTPIIDSQFIFTFLTCLLIIILLRKKLINELTGVTCLALLLSGIICYNQHIVTGFHAQPFHYIWYVIPQSTILVINLLAAEYLEKNHTNNSSKTWWFKLIPVMSLVLYGGIILTIISVFLRPTFVATYLSSDGILTHSFTDILEKIHVYGVFTGLVLVVSGLLLRKRLFLCLHLGTLLSILLIVYFIFDIGLVQYKRYHEYMKPEVGDLQELAPSLRWLNIHTEKESVVLGMITSVKSGPSASTDNVITVYTHNNVYISQYARFFLVPSKSELRDRLYNLMYFMGIRSRQDFVTFMDKMWILFMEGGRLSNAFDDEMRTLRFEEYQRKLSKDLYSELKRYRIDYVFYGPRERSSFKVDPEEAHPFLKGLYDDGVVKIYKII
jgi:hypothetical protein